jgi:hypothetical protein
MGTRSKFIREFNLKTVKMFKNRDVKLKQLARDMGLDFRFKCQT